MRKIEKKANVFFDEDDGYGLRKNIGFGWKRGIFA